MRRTLVMVTAVLGLLSLSLTGAHADRKLRVVATIPDLKSLTEAVGGDLVEVDTLTRGTQNFHEAEVRPSMMLKLRRADALIENGLELDTWADVAVTGAQKPRPNPRAPRPGEDSRGHPPGGGAAARGGPALGEGPPLGEPPLSPAPRA